ncbi:UNVERIFIED_CONTAM: hypothetical protein NCL1_32755 [Trichonephila clavipes]
MLNDDEIVTFVQEESDLINDETNEDKDNNKTFSTSTFLTYEDFQYSYSVRFHILHGSHLIFGYPNNRISKWPPVPIDSDKRRSTCIVKGVQLCFRRFAIDGCSEWQIALNKEKCSAIYIKENCKHL